MEMEVELNPFLVSRQHHLFFLRRQWSLSPIHPPPPPPQPDMEMEVALELLPMLAKRSLLQNSQAASLEILLKLTFAKKCFSLKFCHKEQFLESGSYICLMRKS